MKKIIITAAAGAVANCLVGHVADWCLFRALGLRCPATHSDPGLQPIYVSDRAGPGRSLSPQSERSSQAPCRFFGRRSHNPTARIVWLLDQVHFRPRSAVRRCPKAPACDAQNRAVTPRSDG